MTGLRAKTENERRVLIAESWRHDPVQMMRDGGFEPDPLDERSARLGAVQWGWHWREGAPLSAGLLLGYLEWSDLSGYARAGLGRGNRVAAGRAPSDRPGQAPPANH